MERGSTRNPLEEFFLFMPLDGSAPPTWRDLEERFNACQMRGLPCGLIVRMMVAIGPPLSGPDAEVEALRNAFVTARPKKRADNDA